MTRFYERIMPYLIAGAVVFLIVYALVRPFLG